MTIEQYLSLDKDSNTVFQLTIDSDEIDILLDRIDHLKNRIKSLKKSNDDLINKVEMYRCKLLVEQINNPVKLKGLAEYARVKEQ